MSKAISNRTSSNPIAAAARQTTPIPVRSSPSVRDRQLVMVYDSDERPAATAWVNRCEVDVAASALNNARAAREARESLKWAVTEGAEELKKAKTPGQVMAGLGWYVGRVAFGLSAMPGAAVNELQAAKLRRTAGSEAMAQARARYGSENEGRSNGV